MPLTRVRLLEDVGINSTYKDSRTFENADSQRDFFISKTAEPSSKFSKTNLTYQRKESSIVWGENIEELFKVSYMMFQNTEYSDKWYYAFITDMQYENKSTTKIVFEIDEMQTWLFDVELEHCFIERMHTDTDDYWEHDVDENLDIGEVVIRGKVSPPELNDIAFVLATTADSLGNDVTGQIVTKNYTGVAYYTSVVPSDETFINSFIIALNNIPSDFPIAGGSKVQAIQSIFTMPYALVDTDGSARVDQTTSKVIDLAYNKNVSDLNGYVPKNNKLFSYPYNFFVVSNNQGTDHIFRYKFFDDINVQFQVTGDVGPNPTVYLKPKLYKNSLVNEDEVLTLSNFPICSWTSDIYTEWLANNQVSNAMKLGGSASAIVGGIVTANPIAIGGGVAGVANTIGGFIEKSLLPNPLKGSLTGAGNLASDMQNFTMYQKTVTAEYAKIIDDYFDRYGYKVMRSMRPSLQTRKYWNYFKMLEVNLSGNVPNKSKEKIIEIFKNGVTFWHIDNVGAYDLINDPL